MIYLPIYFNYDHTTAVFPVFRIPCSSRFSSRSSSSFTSCTYSNLLAEATAGGLSNCLCRWWKSKMMDSDVSDYLVLKSGTEPSLPPADFSCELQLMHVSCSFHKHINLILVQVLPRLSQSVLLTSK